MVKNKTTEIEKTLSGERFSVFPHTYLESNVKKHLQEFKEELKAEINRAQGEYEDTDEIINTQMLKHFGDKLI